MRERDTAFLTDLRARIRRFGAAVVALVLALALPTAAWPAQLGNISMSRAPAKRLERAMIVAPSFYMNVGGVAFAGVAEGQGGAVVTGLAYDASRPDGQRLRVTVRRSDGSSTTVTAPLHDWKLRPIAEFADSKHHACVTLFGELKDRERTAAELTAGNKIVNYHPAFEDRLLGLRLLQVDMLVISQHSADLFKEGDRYLLGAGETEPNVALNQMRFLTVASWMSEQTEQFQSYVVSDRGQQVTFGVDGDRLSLTGNPFWDTWRTNPNFDAEAADAAIMARLQQEMIADAGKMTQGELEAKYSEAYQQRRGMELVDELAKDIIELMGDYGRELSAQVRAVGGINPAVYQATLDTMRYAALFRHFKQRDAAAYRRFVQSLSGISAEPVEAPTIIGPY